MAVDAGLVKRDGIADGNIKPMIFVKTGSAGYDHIILCGANDKVAGVSPAGPHDRDSANAAELDEQVEYYVGGRVKLELGGTIAVGAWVKSNAAGEGVTVDESVDGIQNVGGQCIVGGDDGDVGQIEIRIFEFYITR